MSNAYFIFSWHMGCWPEPSVKAPQFWDQGFVVDKIHMKTTHSISYKSGLYLVRSENVPFPIQLTNPNQLGHPLNNFPWVRFHLFYQHRLWSPDYYNKEWNLQDPCPWHTHKQRVSWLQFHPKRKLCIGKVLLTRLNNNIRTSLLEESKEIHIEISQTLNVPT